MRSRCCLVSGVLGQSSRFVLDWAVQLCDTELQHNHRTQERNCEFILTFLHIHKFIIGNLIHLHFSMNWLFCNFVIDKNNNIYLLWYMMWYEFLTVSMKICLITLNLINLIYLSLHTVSSFVEGLLWICCSNLALLRCFFPILLGCRWKRVDSTRGCGNTRHQII